MTISGGWEPVVQRDQKYLFYELNCFCTGENGIEPGGQVNF